LPSQAAFGVLAIFTSTYGPWQIGDGPLACHRALFFKPLSLAAAALVVAVARRRRCARPFAAARRLLSI
jgi:hypothetical protein